MKKQKRYFMCIRDMQGGSFGLDRLQTIKEWRETAIDWAYGDDWDASRDMRGMSEDEIINYIIDMWELEIVEIDIKAVETIKFLLEQHFREEQENLYYKYRNVIDDLVDRYKIKKEDEIK